MIGFAVQSLFLGIVNLKQVWLFVAIALGLAAAERLRAADDGAARRRWRGRRPMRPGVDRLLDPTACQPRPPADAAPPAATDEAIPLGPPATEPRGAGDEADRRRRKPGRRHRSRRHPHSKTSASKRKAKPAPPAAEPDATLGPEEADPVVSITDETTVATRRGQSVIQLPGEMPARKRKTNDVIELPAPAPPPPAEGEDR